MSQEEIITKVKKAIESDPNKDYIQSISLFGSYLHGDAGKNSDIDLLIELHKNIGLFKLMAIQNRISDKVGRPVELMTKNCLSKYFRNEVIKEAKMVYQDG